MARRGTPIQPVAVSCSTHAITRLPAFFDDGTEADITTSELVLGAYDFIEVFASNHRIWSRIQRWECGPAQRGQGGVRGPDGEDQLERGLDSRLSRVRL